MFGVNHLVGFGAGGRRPSYAWNGEVFGSGGAAPNDAWLMNLGEEAHDRHIVVAVAIGDNNTTAITSVTLDGQAMTQVAYGGEGSGYFNYSGLYIIPWPTGVTGTVQINTATGTQTVVTCYALYGLRSAAPIDTVQVQDGNPLSGTLSGLRSGDIVIGVAGSDYTGSNVTWTGLTEDGGGAYNGCTMRAASRVHDGGDSLFVQANFVSPGAGTNFNAAAWR